MSYSVSALVASKTLRELRAELERDRRALDERDRAITLLEKLERERGQAESLQPSAPIAPNVSGLSDAVRMTVESFGSREFTVPDIESHLKHINFPLPAIDPRSRIAMIMPKLIKDNLIELTQKGSGRTPHKYRAKK